MIQTIGMIGTGNMGSAILRGIVEADYVKAGQIVAYDTSSRRIRELEEDIPGIISARDCIEVAERADLIILAVKPIYVVLPKMIPYFVISLINIVTILLISHFVLDMPVYGNLPTLLALCVLYIVLSLALGLFISTLVRSQMVALIICAMVMMVPMMMLSGMLYPIENLPPGLKEVSYLVPARWFIEAIRKVMVEGLGMGSIWKDMLILTAMTVFFFVVSLRKFNDRLE